MARTARLSRRFYETFGDENTNELVGLLNEMDATYLGELRQLNDQNFALLDAKLEQRFAELRGEFRASVAELRGEFSASVGALRGEISASVAELRGESSASAGDLRGEIRATGAELRGEMHTGLERIGKEVAHANVISLRWFIALAIGALVSIVLGVLGMVQR